MLNIYSFILILLIYALLLCFKEILVKNKGTVLTSLAV